MNNRQKKAAPIRHLYRQGDVLLTAIPSLPTGERKKRENATLAYGEVTGHSHAIALEDRNAAEVFEIGERLFLHVSDRGIRLSDEECLAQAREIIFSPDCSMEKALAWINEGSITIQHEEHGPITLPPGDYEVTIQREYQPDSIRNVLD